MRPNVDAELDRLEHKKIIRKVDSASWAAPPVYVPKSDGGIRLCGDYKVTINPYIAVDPYPLPTAQDLFATLAGGKVFTKLDMRQAYHQVELDDESKEYLVINIHQGLYSYEPLSNGVSTAPALFQKMMDLIPQGLEGVLCYLDDVLIVSSTGEDNLAMLAEVMRQFKKHGVRLKGGKVLLPAAEH